MQNQIALMLYWILPVVFHKLIHFGVNLRHLRVGDYRKPPWELNLQLFVQLYELLMAEHLVDGQALEGLILVVVGVPQNIIVILYLLGVGDKGDVGVAHYELVVLEDVANDADQLAALPVEAGVELLVDLGELQELREFVLVAEQIEPGEPGQFAVVEIDDFASELSFYLLEDELGVHELVGQQLYFPLVVAVGHVLVKLAVDDDLLGQEDVPQLVHADPLAVLVHLQKAFLRPLYRYDEIVIRKERCIEEFYLLLADEDKPHVVFLLYLLRTEALEELLHPTEHLYFIVLGRDVPLDDLVEIGQVLVDDEVEAVEFGIDVEQAAFFVLHLLVPAYYPIQGVLFCQVVHLVYSAHQLALHYGGLLLRLLGGQLHAESDVVSAQDGPVRVQLRHPGKHVALVQGIIFIIFAARLQLPSLFGLLGCVVLPKFGGLLLLGRSRHFNKWDFLIAFLE